METSFRIVGKSMTIPYKQNLPEAGPVRRINEDSRLVILPGISHRFQEKGAWDMVLDLTRDWFEFEQVLLCDWE